MQPGAFMIMAQKTLGSSTAVESAKQVVINYYTYLNKEQYQRGISFIGSSRT